MNTLLVCPDLFDTEGGIPRILRLYLKALCAEALENGGRVRVAALNDRAMAPGRLAPYADASLVRAAACGRGRLRLALEILRMPRRGPGRIICGHIGQLALARLIRPDLPAFLVAHGIEVWRPFSPLERAALRRTRRILCVSEFTRRRILDHCPGLDPRKLCVLPNALDPDIPILAAEPPERPRGPQRTIFTVSRLCADDRYKGIDRLIEALPDVRRHLPGTRLRIAGKGDDLPRLQGLAAAAEVDQAVDFLGYVPDPRLLSELDGCDLFALPSTREGFGLVYIEAMARGRPVLGARAGGVPEVVDAATGVLVEPDDAPGLASALVQALQAHWPAGPILDRARLFSYGVFRSRIGPLLA